MNRLTKQISLVLISSSLVLAGCRQQPPPGKEKEKDNPTGGSGFHGGYHPSVGGGSRSGTSSSGVTGSSRGGFGSSSAGVSS